MWRDGRLTRLRAGRSEEGDALAFAPPPEFVELLERLSEEDAP